MVYGNSNGKMTEELVIDFTAYKLQQAGYNNWVNGQQIINRTPTRAMTTLRLLGDEYEQAYRNAFDDMLAGINITGGNADTAFSGIATVLFDQGIHWGRIVGLFVFAASWSVRAMESNRPDIVDNIVRMTTQYLTSERFTTWISQNGGWSGFVEFYNNPANRNGHHDGQFTWTKACTIGIATIAGAAAIFNTFMQKS